MLPFGECPATTTEGATAHRPRNCCSVRDSSALLSDGLPLYRAELQTGNGQPQVSLEHSYSSTQRYIGEDRGKSSSVSNKCLRGMSCVRSTIPLPLYGAGIPNSETPGDIGSGTGTVRPRSQVTSATKRPCHLSPIGVADMQGELHEFDAVITSWLRPK